MKRNRTERNMAIRLKDATENPDDGDPPAVQTDKAERKYGSAVRRCQFCNKAFEGTDRAKFCGSVCRVRSHRKNKPVPRIRSVDLLKRGKAATDLLREAGFMMSKGIDARDKLKEALAIMDEINEGLRQQLG